MKRRNLLLAATTLSGLAATACAGDLRFAPVPVPTEDAAMRAVIVSESANIDGVTARIGYHTLFRSGDRLGSSVFGRIMGRDGKPLGGGKDRISNRPDFTSLLPAGGRLYTLTQFEHLPAAMYLGELSADAEGNLSPLWTRPLDLSAIGGSWNPCAGSVTPWGTHLGGEEYPQDARDAAAAVTVADLDDGEAPEMAAYFGLDPKAMTMEEYRAEVNPYSYGFPTEVRISGAGETSIAKHYAMGRLSVELANVMPDRKTAYISDDGTNVGLFRFVADRKDDLSSGRLYAAKWVQVSDAGGGAATLDWVDLGHGEDAEVGGFISGRTLFSDMFDTAKIGSDGACPDGFLPSNAEARAECLKVKPGMELAASRLETRRYASMLGATTEFRKMEGTAYNPDRNSLYIAMSEVSKGMADGDRKADRGGRNDIRLPKNPCGAIYEMTLDAAYVGTTMAAVIAGKPAAYPSDSPWAGQECDVDGIANPDNLAYIPGRDTLIIAEDTVKGHRNDAVWALGLSGDSLTRIATTPYGAEATSVDWYPDVMGHGYLMLVVQHPYGESDRDMLRRQDEARAYVGYIGPFPPPAD